MIIEEKVLEVYKKYDHNKMESVCDKIFKEKNKKFDDIDAIFIKEMVMLAMIECISEIIELLLSEESGE